MRGITRRAGVIESESPMNGSGDQKIITTSTRVAQGCPGVKFVVTV
jgi:hypothetical protein